MLKKLLSIVALALVLPLSVYAQSGSVTGRVTDKNTGEKLTGANVFIREISRGAVTDLEGKYTISQVPAGRYTLVVTYIGFRESRTSVEVGSGSLQADFQLDADLLGLDEVVVTGVSDATSQRKLAFTVGRVGSAELDQVPAVSASSALQGKIAGVRIISNSGAPGSAAAIRLRGSTSLTGSQAPLVIVDGVILDASLADINSEDIESIEVLKGASAASLYGSRAANGVIQIITKRGKYLSEGQTQVIFRNEFGRSYLGRILPLSKSHHFQIDANGDYILNAGGNRIPEADLIADNPYKTNRDLQNEVFGNGDFSTNFISVQRNTGNGNYALSFSNSDTEGILYGVKGYSRQTVRVNVDQNITNKLSLSASTSYNQSDNEPVTQGPGSPFFRMLLLQPDADIYGTNPDGSKFRLRADPYVSEPNPLYELEYIERDFRRARVLGDFRVNYNPFDWARFEASFGYDRSDVRNSTYVPLGFLSLVAPSLANPEGVNPGIGSLDKFNSQNVAQTSSATATFQKSFDKLNTRFRASYQYENRKYDEFSVGGSGFAVAQIPRLNISDPLTRGASSFLQEIRTENIYGVLDMDYDEKYITSFLLRQDGSSEFGKDERYAIYYRASGAYRLTEDFNIPSIDELKVRASIGTAGLRPPFAAQYETFNVAGGTPSPGVLGNDKLKPAFTTEVEYGVDMEFLRRFSLQLSYSNKVTEDQIVSVPLSASAGGFSSQWRNAGTLEANTWEAQLGAIVMDANNVRWTSNVTFDRTRQKVTKLDFPSRFVGPGEQGAAIFFLTEGENFGIMYGRRWVKSFAELQRNPAYATAVETDYEVNSDGYLVRAGSQGKLNEAPIRYFELNDAGALVGDFNIGDTNPDFNFAVSNTVSWKGLSVYALLDAQIGGKIYNQTKQWTFRELRHGDFDQRGKSEANKKTVNYYSALYDANNANEYFVEDGSFLKLREVAINYTLNRRQLGVFGNSVDRIRLGIIGRNLLTFTKYSGYDPEVAGLSGDASNYRFDGFNYPNFRTFTGVIEIAF
jgi:TonB-linked SusC/RagA family outer membrane protein